MIQGAANIQPQKRSRLFDDALIFFRFKGGTCIVVCCSVFAILRPPLLQNQGKEDSPSPMIIYLLSASLTLFDTAFKSFSGEFFSRMARSRALVSSFHNRDPSEMTGR